jgi:hypothetical protein
MFEEIVSKITKFIKLILPGEVFIEGKYILDRYLSLTQVFDYKTQDNPIENKF